MMKFAAILSLINFSLASQSKLLAPSKKYNSSFSFDLNYYHAPKWMTALPSTTNLSLLSIPGTHDSLTSSLISSAFRCQNHPLITQLLSGIRYLDIRARLVNNTLQIYHEDAFTGYSYPDVLTILFNFLEVHPGEMLFMRLKEESTPINSTTDFVQAFNHYRLNDPLTAPGCSKHFYLPLTPAHSTLPALGTLRGKILILQNFGSVPAEYGIKWESSMLVIQDDYDIPDLHDGLDRKFAAVVAGLEAAAKWDGRLFLGHVSASVGVLPVEAAAGTRGGSVVGLNDRLGAWLSEGNGGVTGVVIMDFPGGALVREILERNGKLKQNCGLG